MQAMKVWFCLVLGSMVRNGKTMIRQRSMDMYANSNTDTYRNRHQCHSLYNIQGNVLQDSIVKCPPLVLISNMDMFTRVTKSNPVDLREITRDKF